MRLQVVGPLIFWSALFAVGAAIKFAAFGDATAVLQLAPEAALWATGILFSLTVSEQTYSGARLTPRIKRYKSKAGYSVIYDVDVADDPAFTPKFLYLFVVGMAIWIFCILLSGFGASGPTNFDNSLGTWRIVAIALSYLLASLVVGAALRTLYEVTR